MDFIFFNQLMLILALSAVTVAFFKRFQLPESLGYLFVGIVLGPTTSGLIEQDFDIALLAEIGVVFLLFTLGLEFSMKTIMAMKKEVFGLGGLQVLLTSVGIFGGLIALNFATPTSFVCASALALSSTAIVSKELTQSNEIRSRQGQLAIGVLLFQDIAAVIFLIVIPALIGGSSDSIVSSLGFSFAEGVVFVIFMLAIGKWILPIIFHEVAKARSEELFVLMALVIALMAAWLSHAMGLSMALGGFVAGMMMGESRYKHQVEADIKPFRDVLLGLFFVSVGLMLDMNILATFWKAILLGTVALIIFKFLVIYTLARTFEESRNTALRTSLSLAQGGEFCFALIALASQYGESGDHLTSIVLAVTILSMVMAPLLIRNSNTIANLAKFDKSEQNVHRVKEKEVHRQTAHIHHHTLICGYGRIGQTIARFLAQENRAYVAIDDDPMHVHEAGLAGDPVFFGDCRKLELLIAVGLERANQVIICIDRPDNALKILQTVRQQSPQIPVLVRTKDDSRSDELKKAGATVVIPEVLESSLVVVKHALLMLGINPAHVRQRVNEARAKGYEILNGVYPGISDYLLEKDKKTYRHAITLGKNCAANQKTIESLDFMGADVSIVEVRRDKVVLQSRGDIVLNAGDIVVLTGSNSDISHIEKLFD